MEEPKDKTPGAKALATGGIYAYTRNPLYLALTFVYLGIASATDDLWLLPLTVPLLVVMR